jgi:hypothetical protein
VLPLVPADGKSRALFAEILARLGALSAITTDEAGTLPYRLAGALLRHPWLEARTLAHVAGWLAPAPYLSSLFAPSYRVSFTPTTLECTISWTRRAWQLPQTTPLPEHG